MRPDVIVGVCSILASRCFPILFFYKKCQPPQNGKVQHSFEPLLFKNAIRNESKFSSNVLPLAANRQFQVENFEPFEPPACPEAPEEFSPLVAPDEAAEFGIDEVDQQLVGSIPSSFGEKNNGSLVILL